jgi:hypothetical protein
MHTEAQRIAVIRLELEMGGLPPRGVAIGAGAERQPFWGWLELMQVLEVMQVRGSAAHSESSASTSECLADRAGLTQAIDSKENL